MHGRYYFDYIDMPHHGSKHNDPEPFLSKISSTVCAVSTDSKRHDHPHDDTLHFLNQAVTKNYIKHLLFTYSDERPGNRTISKSFSEENKKKLLFTHNNPENRDCKQCLLVKLSTPVEQQEWNITQKTT